MKSSSQAILLVVGLLVLTGCGSGTSAPPQSQPTQSRAPVATSQPTAALPPVSVPPTTPHATVAPTPLGEVPDELQFRWIGPLRDVPQINPKTNFTGLEISAHTAWFYPYTQGDGPDLSSTTSSPSDHQLSFVTVADGADCHVNDTGTYRYSLDASQTRLTFTVLSDPCQARTAAFSGDWTRSACPNPRGWCLGDLAPGEYSTAVFTPFIPVQNWQYDYGEMSYTVPNGWSNPEDEPGGYRLEQHSAPEFTAIYAFADVLAHAQGPECPLEPDPAVGASAADLTDWLASLPSVVTTRPAAITIGGLTGSTVDVSVDSSWPQTCPFSEGKPAAQLFSNADPRHQFDWGLVGDGHMRLFVLALPDDRTLLIDIESTTKQDWDALLPAAMPVVNSFEFSP